MVYIFLVLKISKELLFIVLICETNGYICFYFSLSLSVSLFYLLSSACKPAHSATIDLSKVNSWSI